MIKEIENKIRTEISFVKDRIEEYLIGNKKIFISSSFQSHSIPMLHLISQMMPDIPIYFVDTGFHFPETISYRDEIEKTLNLNIKTVSSKISKINQIGNEGKFLFVSDPDYCCDINKVGPMQEVAREYDVWLTGVRKDQSAHRKGLTYEAEGKNGILRFHPMLNWDDKMINTYISKNNLLTHPLEKDGYKSIGCAPCTSKPKYDERSGRWLGMNKTECGLHLGIKNKENG